MTERITEIFKKLDVDISGGSTVLGSVIALDIGCAEFLRDKELEHSEIFKNVWDHAKIALQRYTSQLGLRYRIK